MEIDKNNSKELYIFILIIIITIIVFSYIILGVTGIRVAFGIILVSLPFYLILNNFSLTQGEKFVFSILMGLTIFSSLVYILGFVISFRVAIAVIFVLLIGISIVIRRYKSKNKN